MEVKASKKEQKKELIIQKALELFAKNGFYTTTIPDIAKALKISVGNMYNYFKSKDILAKEIIQYISSYLGIKLREINEKEIPTQDKITQIVTVYFQTAKLKPEMIDYFLRVFLSRERGDFLGRIQSPKRNAQGGLTFAGPFSHPPLAGPRKSKWSRCSLGRESYAVTVDALMPAVPEGTALPEPSCQTAAWALRADTSHREPFTRAPADCRFLFQKASGMPARNPRLSSCG